MLILAKYKKNKSNILYIIVYYRTLYHYITLEKEITIVPANIQPLNIYILRRKKNLL